VKAIFPRPEEITKTTPQKYTQKRTQKQQAILDFFKAHPEAG
jgi:hypothetical protein